MDFFAAVEARRSVRKYTDKLVPAETIHKAIDAALNAPNSSNMQTWKIFWVQDKQKKAALVEACFSQGAAKTAQELVVFSVDRKEWRNSQKAILAAMGPNMPKEALSYYTKLMPFLYAKSYLAHIKWLLFNTVGLFRPMARSPWDMRGVNEVCIKSCALACENFMLAISAQGFDTCPMEGFDERRVKKLLGLRCHERVVMVISVGERDPKGIWGERFRRPKDSVFKII